MRVKQQFINFFAFPLCVAFSLQMTTASAVQTQGAAASAKASAGEVQMIQPSDLFRDFPEIKWGMSFQDARKAIEKQGAHPVSGSREAATELVWTATFNGMEGRGAVHFKQGAGLDEILVGVYAYEKQKEVYEAWLRKLVERHGAAKEELDNDILVSKVWRLKNGHVIELRSLKDINSPVVDIHWVKE